jgi:hypothetical protein
MWSLFFDCLAVTFYGGDGGQKGEYAGSFSRLWGGFSD